jgi:hypothetical protein
MLFQMPTQVFKTCKSLLTYLTKEYILEYFYMWKERLFIWKVLVTLKAKPNFIKYFYFLSVPQTLLD